MEVYPRLVGTLLEQHYRQSMEQCIAENQRLQDAKVSTVFDLITNALVIFDEDGRPTRLNPAAQAAYGFDMVGMSSTESSQKINLCSAEGGPIPLPKLPVLRALLGEIVHNERLLLIDPQGYERIMLASAGSFRSNSGQIRGACLVGNDITEMEAAERDAQSSIDQVELHHRLIEYQERKVDQIAHELHDMPVQHLLGVLLRGDALQYRPPFAGHPGAYPVAPDGLEFRDVNPG